MAKSFGGIGLIVLTALWALLGAGAAAAAITLTKAAAASRLVWVFRVDTRDGAGDDGAPPSHHAPCDRAPSPAAAAAAAAAATAAAAAAAAVHFCFCF